MTTKRLLVLACAAACCLLAARAEIPAIRSGHPRIFFNSDTWPEIKARAEAPGPQHDALVALLRRADAYPTNPVCRNTEAVSSRPSDPILNVRDWGPEAMECALAWRFTGRGTYLEKAKTMLRTSIAAYREAYRNRRAVHWYSTHRILALTAYDWIFEALSDDERRAIIVPLVEHVEEVQPGPGRPAITRRNGGSIVTGFYGVSSLLWYSGLAAHGDGYCDTLARSHLEKGAELFLKMLDHRAKTAGDDGGLSSAVPDYSMGVYPYAHFNFFHTWLSATGENIAMRYPSLALFPNWIWWNWIPTPIRTRPHCFGFGDDQHEQNFLECSHLYTHMLQHLLFFRDADPAAARLAAALAQRAQDKTFHSAWPMYPFILPSAYDTVPFSSAELENAALKARHFETMGQIVMRSGWRPDSVYCLYTAGASVHMHKHLDEGNFVIYHNDFLALDTGSRAAETDTNLRYYYSQTVAHNCILIHQPGEPAAHYWGLKSDEPEAQVNYGGQYRDRSARVLAFETSPAFSYVASDQTAAYGKKCTEAVRQFVHLQPDVFVVYDRVGSSDPSYRKEWLLHTQNKPDIAGHVLRADCGTGRLFCETLLPEGARLNCIGGPEKRFWSAGKNWELDKGFSTRAEKKAQALGVGPYFGNWRLEVSPAAPALDNRFLNVLSAVGTGDAMPRTARLVQDASHDGVTVSLAGSDGTTQNITVLFNRTGAVGGELHRVRRAANGTIVEEESRSLADTVHRQSGVILN